jgi:S1-C subfamily serine protease
MTKHASPLVALLLCLAASPTLYGVEHRYVARFADGTRQEGNSFVNWHDNNAQPQLEGRSLLDPANPFRWIRDRTLSPGPEPTACVELATGDRFPGTVVGYAAGGEEYDPLPGHFVVEPLTPLRPQPEAPRSTIRVLASQVRKIVWQRQERARYQPGTLLLRDGRSLTYRAIRFDDGFASLLTTDGNKRVSFQEIAEAHLPVPDVWQRYLEELAVLSPHGTSRLYQLETTDGLIVTGSKERLSIYHQGNAQEVKSWIHGLQPAWSLDVLWIPNENVWLRRSFAPHEVPLSRFPPIDVQHQATLGSLATSWRRDRNLQGEPLRSGSREWGFGIGCTTTSGLTFQFPSGAKSLRGSIGLDRLAGQGGCAKGEILLGGKPPQKLWESPVLVGSDVVHDFGPLGLPLPGETQQIVLRADAVLSGRPAGADPFEVRDFVDWLDVIVEYDPAVLLPAVRSILPSTVPAWTQWQVELAPIAADKPAKFESFDADQLLPRPGRFRTGVVLEQPLVISRKLSPTPHDQWLVMHITRAKNQGSEPRLEARIGGELVGEFKVPLNNPNVRPLAVPLMGYQQSKQKEIDLQLTLFSEPSSGPIEWRALRTAEQLPTLHRVFEEENQFEAVTGAPPTLEAGEGSYGVKSLKVAAGGVVRRKFARPLRIRENPRFGEFRQLRFSLLKKGQGHVVVELDAQSDDRPRLLRYGQVAEPPAEEVKAHEGPLPDTWTTFTRDLFADFGSMDLESLTLRVPDGELALWDHIYLGSNAADLDQVRSTPSPELVQRKVEQTVADALVAHAQPLVTLIDFGEGRVGNGVFSNPNGEMLTAGHLVLAPNREVKITLASGQELKGKTAGVCRNLDLGMVKIDPPGNYPAFVALTATEPPTQHFYAAVLHRQGAKGAEAQGHLVDLRRVFKGTTWTTLQVPEALCGGALINRDKQLVGVLTRFSPFGGAEFANMHKYYEIEGRLRAGEVWGKWRDGTGGQFGFTAESQREGAKLTAVDTGGPAAQAGLQVGDIVAKIDSQPVGGLHDVFAILAERDPGYEATVELLRGGQPTTVKLKLTPRMP